MGQYTIKDIQDQTELLEADVQRIYRSLYTKLGFFPKSLDQVPYYIITKLYPSPTKEPLTITPARGQQEITTPENIKYDPITVEAVTSAIDNNIQPENIKEGVSILGVAGTLSDGGPGGSGTFIVPSDMSFGYSQFTEIPSYLDFRNMVNMHYTFAGCANLTTIPLIDTSSVQDMDHTFAGCANLTTIPQLATTNVRNMAGMFSGCSGLTTTPSLNTTNVQDMSSMFNGCSSLTTIPQMDTTNVQDMSSMFNGCYNLTTIPQMDTTNVTSMNRMFNECISLTEIPLLDTSNVGDMSYMFLGCNSLTNIPQLVTSNVGDMSYMFSGCISLTEIPLLDTSNVINMDHMFAECYNLTTIPQLDVTNVRNMYYMFYGCGSLTSIPQLNTSNVTDMSGVFSDCTALTTVEGIDFSGSEAEITHLFGYSTEMPNLTRFIVNGKLNDSIKDEYSIKALTAIDYDSVKSILTAAANTIYGFARTLAFNRTMTDQNGELAALVTQCAAKGWSITGLTLN